MGYWPSVRSRWLDIGQVHKNRTRPISSHLDRTSLVTKGFIIGLSKKYSPTAFFCCQDTCIFVFWWKWLNTKFCFNTDSNSWWIFWSISDCGKRALRGDLEISPRMQGAACFFPGRRMKASSLQFTEPLRPPSSYWKKEWSLCWQNVSAKTH